MRVRGDLIEMYISLNGLVEFIWERNPVVNTPKVEVLTGSNGVKIRRETFKSKIRNVRFYIKIDFIILRDYL